VYATTFGNSVGEGTGQGRVQTGEEAGCLGVEEKHYRESGCAVKSATLILTILCSSLVLAKDHRWSDAKVIDITCEKGGAVVVPVAALVGVPVSKTFYWIQTDDMIYVLGPTLTKRQLLNVTLHGPTKIAIDGNSAHILDDEGKNRKLPIVEKVARPKIQEPQ
jgi:hypothetical protein